MSREVESEDGTVTLQATSPSPSPHTHSPPLTDGQDGPLLLMHFAAGDKVEDVLVEFVKERVVLLIASLLHLSGHVALQLAGRPRANLITSAP